MNTLKSFSVYFLSIFMVLGLSGCLIQDRQEEVEFNDSTLINELLLNPDLSLFTGALSHGQFLVSFGEVENVTLLALPNEVMEVYIETILASDTTWNVLSDIPPLVFNRTFNKVLQFHILPDQTILTENLANNEVVITSTGVGLVVEKTDGVKFTRVNNTNLSCKILVPDLVESNGVIHIVDDFLAEY